MQMDGIEGIGEAVTGAMVARAAEPKAGEGAGDGAACRNCGNPVLRNFCPECGQQAHVHRTVSAFWHDVAHSVLHFEGKFWRTLPLLAWRPGELTRRYIEGERARFVSPMAAFLFSVFLMFAVFSTVGGPAFSAGQKDEIEAANDAQAERKKLTDQLTKLEADRAQAVKEGRSTRPINISIQATKSAIGMTDAATPKEEAATGDLIQIDSDDDLGWFDGPYKKAKENPSLLLYKIQANAYKFSWALIPISVPFVWLLFLHRQRYRRSYKMYDHIVFVTYSLAFMSLGAVAYTLLKLAGMNGTIALLPFLVVPLHMYRQLRGAYQLSRWSAAWRTVMLLLFAAIASSLFMMLLLGVGVLG
jgi:hypothetical protein